MTPPPRSAGRRSRRPGVLACAARYLAGEVETRQFLDIGYRPAHH
ncbi:MAG: hypothetical protein ACRDSZ_03660 [Pseudonocardiaceae bacterium]